MRKQPITTRVRSHYKMTATDQFMFKILSEEIPYQSNSEGLFECVRDLPEAIWLDSGKPRSLQGRFDIISACPQAILETNGEQSYLLQDNHRSEKQKNPFDLAGLFWTWSLWWVYSNGVRYFLFIHLRLVVKICTS